MIATMKFFVGFLSLLLVLFLLVVGVSYLVHPKDNRLSDEQKVMKIAVAYIEENYGTDYVINGEVRNHTLTKSGPEGDTVYNYPTASFRIPSNYFESGQSVNIMVDLGTEEIVKVYSSPCKGLLPYDIDVSNWEAEVHQGESTSTNYTLTLVYTEEEVTVSFSLKLGAYNNMPVGSNYPFPFETIFEPEQLVLKYQEPKSVILTLTADEAPLGLYTITIFANDGEKGIGATLWIRVVE
jgi:hypothetical protein